MDKLSMAIIAMEAHVACSNERLRQAWDIIHAKLVEENGSSHNSQSDAIALCKEFFVLLQKGDLVIEQNSPYAGFIAVVAQQHT